MTYEPNSPVCNICNGTAFKDVSCAAGAPDNTQICLACGQTMPINTNPSCDKCGSTTFKRLKYNRLGILTSNYECDACSNKMMFEQEPEPTTAPTSPTLPFCEIMKTFAQNASEVLKSNALLIVAFHTDTYDSFSTNQEDDDTHYVAIFPHGQEDKVAAIFQIQHPIGETQDNVTPLLDPLEAFINVLTLVGYEVYTYAYQNFPDDPEPEDIDPEIVLFDPLNPPEEYAVVLFQDVANVTGKELPKQFDPLVKLQADKADQAQQKFKEQQEEQRRSITQMANQSTQTTQTPTPKSVTWQISMTVDTQSGKINADSYQCEKIESIPETSPKPTQNKLNSLAQKLWNRIK